MEELDKKLKNKLYKNDKNNNEIEYLLNPENNRLTIYPIENDIIWNEYKKQQAAFWTAEEIDFSKDYDDYLKLSLDEQYFIKMILAFFSSSDTIVNINLMERFINDVKIREVIVAYTWQMMMENIHSEVYSLQIDNIIKNNDEKTKLFNAVKEFPCINEKIAWAVKWIESNENYTLRLIAFVIVEGIFFSGSFCAIFWLKKKNIMPGLCSSNELISRDEGLHCNMAIILYKMLNNKLNQDIVHSIFNDAVNIECNFICNSLPCAILGMNSNLMIQYIKFVADRLLVDLGYEKKYNTTNPFDFMESISVEGKTNFFEARPTQYQKANILNKSRDNIFQLTENF